MARAAKACSVPSCPHAQPCPDHPTKAWAGSQRNQRRRSGSREQRVNRTVMLLHEGICHVCGLGGADEVDHVVPTAEGGEDTLANRRPIHSVPCHRDKTQAEAARARGVA